MPISRLFAFPMLVLAVSTATAQAPAVVQVQLASFSFTPKSILLDHGQPYVLRLSNVSGSGHDFTAQEFFTAANVEPGDRKWIQEGVVEVPSGQVREIHLTAPAAAATYKLKCSHSLHKVFGMSGTIVIR
jgi:uncharacterized cupredoxin-like copper-binding protein